MKYNFAKDNFDSLLFTSFSAALRSIIIAGYINNSELNSFTLVTYRCSMIDLLTFLKLHSSFLMNVPIDCSSIDLIEHEYRFAITYIFQSTINNSLISVATKTNDLLPLISVQSLYPAFGWAEREIWDLMGIQFIKHNDLRRILTDYGFEGHPLRKDFPLSGYREIYYDDSTKHIEYIPIELSQGFRLINALSPWQNEKEV